MIPRKIMYERDENRIFDHFTDDIVGDDRYLRFGTTANDDFIMTYLTNSFQNFGTENMWFIVENNDKVVGTVHVNIDSKNVAEMGFTVSPGYRGKGIAQNLFYRGSTWAAMRGAKTIFTHCLSQNKVMQHIAKKNGMSIITLDATEREASIKVTKGVLTSYYVDATMDHIAFVDHAVMKQHSMVNKFMRL
jgi:RimJ/RimL family protein N-acetyltransferase